MRRLIESFWSFAFNCAVICLLALHTLIAQEQTTKSLGAVTTTSLNGVIFADQFPGASPASKIDAAFRSCGDKSCFVVIPANLGSGGPTTIPPNVSVLDLRNGTPGAPVPDRSTASAGLYFKRFSSVGKVTPAENEFFMPAESVIRADSFSSGTDRLFNIYSQVVMGTPPKILRDSPQNAKVAGAFFAFRGQGFPSNITSLNPLVQFDDNSGSAVAIEVDVNAKSDTPVQDPKMHDGVAIVSGWFGKPFRALSISATGGPKNAWRYGIDVHNFTERGIKVGDATPGTNAVGLDISGANMTHGLLVRNMSVNQIQIQPSDDTDGCVMAITSSTGDKVTSCLYKEGGLRMNAEGARWFVGNGAPSGQCANGSLYTRSDPSGGLYLCAGEKWIAK